MTASLPAFPAATLVAIGLDASVKAFVAVGIATVLAWMLRQHSARVRYHVWLGALLVTAVGVAAATTALWNAGSSGAPVELANHALPRPIWLVLAGVWLVGVVALVLRIGAGFLALALDKHRLPAAREPSWQRHIGQARSAFGLRGRVRVVYDRPDTVPVCWGLFDGTIAVPSTASRWPESLRRSVVLHECAHLQRRDPLVMLVEQIVCAALWFNPAVWLIVRRLRQTRELACDEAVVSAGVRRDTYAELLVALARQCRPKETPAHAFVRVSELETRVATLLTAEDFSRRNPGRPWSGVLLATAIVWATFSATRVVTMAGADRETAVDIIHTVQQPGESPASFRTGIFGVDR